MPSKKRPSMVRFDPTFLVRLHPSLFRGLVRFDPTPKKVGAFAPHLFWCVSTPPSVRLHPTFFWCDCTPPFYLSVRLYPTFSHSSISIKGFVVLHVGHHMCLMCPARLLLLSFAVAYIRVPQEEHRRTRIYLAVFLIPTGTRQTPSRSHLYT